VIASPTHQRSLEEISLRELAARLIVGSNIGYGAQQHLKRNLESGTLRRLTYNSRKSATGGVASNRKPLSMLLPRTHLRRRQGMDAQAQADNQLKRADSRSH
jgi:hypothetical protein